MRCKTMEINIPLWIDFLFWIICILNEITNLLKLFFGKTKFDDADLLNCNMYQRLRFYLLFLWTDKPSC